MNINDMMRWRKRLRKSPWLWFILVLLGVSPASILTLKSLVEADMEAEKAAREALVENIAFLTNNMTNESLGNQLLVE